MNTAIIRLTLFLLIGVCSGFLLELPLKMAFLALLPCLILFLIAYFRARKLLFPDLLFGSSTVILFLSLGIFLSSLHLPVNQPRHYINQVAPEEIPLLKLSIKENLKPDLYNEKFIAEVEMLNHEKAHGKILLLLPKDSLKTPFLEGEEILISAPIDQIRGPLNPHQFDYKEFMSRKGVEGQVNLQKGVYEKLSSQDRGLRTVAAKFRKQITLSLRQNDFDRDELAVVQALLLGQKQDISSETYNNFTAAGAIHILAVSGLHVGVILMLLHWLFMPLKRLKHGSILKTLFIILSLWGFAVLAGLSPSVVRAVTMFSFIAIGLEINRRTSALNSVFLSLLLLLLIKPQWIFEVGFQLSYLAVISIIVIQPLLSRLYEPKTILPKYLWNLLTVTIAAQVGVMPLSLFYFHQFPGLFFLSNLLILPFLGLILILGILLILLALFDVLPSLYAKSYENVIETLNATVKWIANREEFLFKDISFSAEELWGWYLLIFLGLLLWKNFSYGRLTMFLSSVLLLQFVYISKQVNREEELIVFHKSRNSLVGKTSGGKLLLYHDLSEEAGQENLLRNFIVGEDISFVEEKDLKNIYLQKGQYLILLDSSGILPPYLPKKAHLLLTGSPKINLQRLVASTQIVSIIADGSNFPSLVQRWKRTAIRNNIKFHYTGEDGAYFVK